jgi:hypothetical protein
MSFKFYNFYQLLDSYYITLNYWYSYYIGIPITLHLIIGRGSNLWCGYVIYKWYLKFKLHEILQEHGT